MNPFASMTSALKDLFPGIRLEITPPLKSDGAWSLDIDHKGSSISVHWDPSVGFALSTVRPESYGESPDETYHEDTSTLARLITLIAFKHHTAPQIPIKLAHLRERRGYSQTALAAKLDIRQSTLSATEHREEVELGTVRSYVAALGGRLELLAVFDDVCYIIDTKPVRRRPKAERASMVRRWFSATWKDPEKELEPKLKNTLNFAIPT